MEHERLPETVCGGSQNKWRYCLSESSPSPFLSRSHDSHSPEVSFSAFIFDKKNYINVGAGKRFLNIIS